MHCSYKSIFKGGPGGCGPINPFSGAVRVDASPLSRFISDVHTEAVLGTASENASPTASVDHRCTSVPWISSPTLRPCVSDPSISHHHVRARLSPTPPAAAAMTIAVLRVCCPFVLSSSCSKLAIVS